MFDVVLTKKSSLDGAAVAVVLCSLKSSVNFRVSFDRVHHGDTWY